MTARIPITAPELAARRRLAPYTKDVLRELEAGRQPNVYVLTGPDAWKRAARRISVHGRGSALVLPDDAEPAELKWPAVDAVFVDARGISRKEAVKLGAAIIGNGTRFAALLGPGDEPMAFRRES